MDTHARVPRSAPTLEPEAPGASLETLYREHVGFVWRVVRRLGVDDEATEDVVHAVFMIAGRRLDAFEGRGAPTTWLYGIARRVAANHRRGRARAERKHAEQPEPVPVPGPEDALHRRDAARIVQAFLATLPGEQRRVFELVDIEGLSGPEVSEALGVSLNSVYSRLRLARRRFEAFLEPSP